jgi:2-polyprenyl-3-methyl-5-hydroxy-6-metoxy-1,4-benzoquinol methylase
LRNGVRVREYRLLRCRRCATLFCADPRAHDRAAAIYADRTYFRNPRFGWPEEGGYHGYRDYLSDRRHIEEKFAEILTRIEEHRPPGALLDVGAGPGLLLSAARERGWDGIGLDPNPWAAEFAGLEVGVEVRRQGLLDADLEAGSFDAVTLMDTIEHLTDPERVVQECRRVLRPGGILALSTADAGSPVSRVLGRRWPEVQRVPEHLVLFSVRGLAALLHRAGFATLGWHSVGKRSDVATIAADVSPVAPALGRRVAAALARRRLGRRVIDIDPRTKFCLYARRVGATEALVSDLPRVKRLRATARVIDAAAADGGRPAGSERAPEVTVPVARGPGAA